MDTVFKNEWEEHGVKGFLIMIASQTGGPPSQSDCKKFRSDHGITGMTLLFDPTGSSAPYGGQETTVVLDSDARITYTQKGDWMAGIKKALEANVGYDFD